MKTLQVPIEEELLKSLKIKAVEADTTLQDLVKSVLSAFLLGEGK